MPVKDDTALPSTENPPQSLLPLHFPVARGCVITLFLAIAGHYLQEGVCHVGCNGLSKAREAPAWGIAIDVRRQFVYLVQTFSQ